MADFFNTSIDYLIGYTDIEHKIEVVTECMLNTEEQTVVSLYRSLSSSQKKVTLRMLEEFNKSI